jgi:hypothetical protein
MPSLRWLTLLWPGLPQLWYAGAWSGLAMAIGFAALLDLGLLSSRIWTELFAPEMRSAIWLALGTTWAAAAAMSCRWIARLRLDGRPEAGADLFELARVEYLQGHWFEAETALRRLLDRNTLDQQSRLMLAGLLGRTGRRGEAVGELDRMTRMDGAEVWHLEIARWRTRLAATSAESGSDGAAEGTRDATDATHGQLAATAESAAAERVARAA